MAGSTFAPSKRLATLLAVVASLAVLAAPQLASAQEHLDDLSRELSNPVASLISVPIQVNLDFGAGADNEGFGSTTNIQPVIPIALSDDWTMISRTIVPIASRDYLPPPDGDTFGFGDVLQSLFFSPKPEPGGIIWGAGPAFLIPTATDDALGAGKIGVGPTAVVLKQTGPWTVGVLANHLWSIAGDYDREDVSSTFLQPFASYSLGQGRSVALNTESTYDWVGEQWTVPVNLSYSQVFTVGTQAMSWTLGGKYCLDAPEDGPQWGLRAALTWMFPEGRS